MKKKTIILCILVLISLLFFIFISNFAYDIFSKKYHSNSSAKSLFEFSKNNQEEIFSVDRITYFSSCSAKIETNPNSTFKVSDLYQYTDIAIFLENTHSNNSDNTSNSIATENLTSKNTLKSVTISDIKYELSPSIGTPSLYYKNLNDFASSKFEKENIIENTLNFNTTSENEIDYSSPILYNNCANPITLCYVNSNIKDEYTLNNDITDLSLNGSLLKKCGITLNSISCKLSFIITITNNLDEVYACPFILNMPLSTENSTIYDGSLTLKDSTNYRFIKIN